jgi:hypothetical protein
MPHTIHDIGVASQIGPYSDAIEAEPNLRLNTESNPETPMRCNSLEWLGSDDHGVPVRATDGEYRRWESNPHGGSPPEDFKSSASAFPPRRQIFVVMGLSLIEYGSPRLSTC